MGYVHGIFRAGGLGSVTVGPVHFGQTLQQDGAAVNIAVFRGNEAVGHMRPLCPTWTTPSAPPRCAHFTC